MESAVCLCTALFGIIEYVINLLRKRFEMGELITLKDIKHNEAIDKYLKRASLNLEP